MSTADQVKLFVDGQAFPFWTSYSVSADMRRPGGVFTLRAPTPPDGEPPVGAGGVVALKVDGRQVMRGRVDDATARVGADLDELTITGRDAGGLLTSCAADPTWRWRKVPLSNIVAEIAQYVGIDRDANVEFDPTITDWKVDAGDTAWQVLRAVVESEGMRVWVAADGSLEVSQWKTYAAPVGTLVRLRDGGAGSSNNILSSEVRRSFRDAYSEVRVLGEWDSGTGTAQIVGTWLDLTAPAFRLGVFQERVTSQDEADNRAADIGRRAALDRFEAQYTVKGHLNDQGVPWQLNDMVEVHDDVEGVNGTLLIVARTFTNGTGGQRTRLTLLDPAGLTHGGITPDA